MASAETASGTVVDPRHQSHGDEQPGPPPAVGVRRGRAARSRSRVSSPTQRPDESDAAGRFAAEVRRTRTVASWPWRTAPRSFAYTRDFDPHRRQVGDVKIVRRPRPPRRSSRPARRRCRRAARESRSAAGSRRGAVARSCSDAGRVRRAPRASGAASGLGELGLVERRAWPRGTPARRRSSSSTAPPPARAAPRANST